MSHTVKVQIELNDLNVLKATCERLNLNYQINGTAKMYDGTIHQGFVINLPNWHYPIVISEKNLYYDNYEGRWGDIAELNKLKTYYGVEKVKRLARAKGYSYRELMINDKPQVRITIA